IHEASGNTVVAFSDERGRYRLPVRSGVYRLTAELAGFTTVTKADLEVQVGQQAVINFQISPSTLKESVTVTSASPLVDVSQSKLGGNIDSRQMQELPINGRNWMQLTLLAPGSRANAVVDSPVTQGFAGGEARFQLNVDGQEVTSTIAGSSQGEPRFSRDAMA